VGILVVAEGGDNVGFALGVFVGVFVGIAVVGGSGDNVGFAKGVSVGGLDPITISPCLNTFPVTVPFLISGQVVFAQWFSAFSWKVLVKLPLPIDSFSADITVVLIVVFQSWSSHVPMQFSVSITSESTVVPASNQIMKNSLIPIMITTSKL